MHEHRSMPSTGRHGGSSPSNRHLEGSRSVRAQQLRLKLFGGPSLERGGIAISLSPAQEVLLCVVTLLGRNALARRKVLPLLWREGTERTLRRRLSQTLYSLHRRMGSSRVVLAHNDSLALNRQLISTDLDRVRAFLEAGKPVALARLVRRGFLPGLRMVPTNQLEELIASHEVRFQREAREFASKQCQLAETRADWDALCVAARARLILDPLDEQALAALLKGEALRGRAEAAQQAFERFSERARRRERCWTPGPELLSLVARMQRLATSQATEEPSQLCSANQDPPLFGREREMRDLQGMLSRNSSPGFDTLVIVGEPGIGKTRLANEGLAQAELFGYRVLSGRCSPLETSIPLAPLRDALGPPMVTEQLRLLDEPWRTVFATEGFGSLATQKSVEAAPTIDPYNVPHRLCEAFRLLFQRLSTEAPIVLFLDDFQWSDSVTQSVLSYVHRRWDSGRLVLVATSRSSRGPKGPVREEWALCRQHWHREVVLDELSRSEVAKLLSHLQSRKPPRRSVDRALRVAGGVPLYLMHYASLEGKSVKPSPPHKPREGTFPASLTSVLAARLGGLPHGALRILHLLSLSMRPVPVEQLCSILAVPEQRLWRNLKALEERMLIRWKPSGASVRHDLIRNYLQSTRCEAESREMHQSLAEHYVRQGIGSPGEIAYHYFHGGGGLRGQLAATTAAQLAERSGAYRECLAYSEMALSLSVVSNQRAEALMQYAVRLFRLGRLEVAAGVLPEAIQAAAKSGRDREAAQLKLALSSCQVQLGKGCRHQVLTQLHELFNTATAFGWWTVAADVVDLQVKVLEALGDIEHIQAAIAKVSDILPRVGPLEGRVRLGSIVALSCFFGDPKIGLDHARRSASLARDSHGRETLRLHALNRLLACLIASGRLNSNEGRSALRESRKLAARSGDLLLRCYPVANEAAWLLDSGHPKQALRKLSPLLDLFEERPAPEGHLRVRGNRGLALAQLGEFEKAHKELALAASLTTPLTSSYLRRHILSGIGLCLLQLGRVGEARKIAQEVLPLPERWTADPTVVVTFLAQLEHWSGRSEKAIALLETVATDVKIRFPVHWVELVISKAGFSRKMQLRLDRTELDAALEVTRECGLPQKEEQLLRLRA